MAKPNLEQLQAKAKELNIDFDGSESKAQLTELINAEENRLRDERGTTPEETLGGVSNPAALPEQNEEGELKNEQVEENQEDGLVLVTSKPVLFKVNGKRFEGSRFTFNSKEDLEDRKKMLIAFYGEGIVK